MGYGFAGAATAIAAYDGGVEVLLLEKAREEHKGGNSRVSANIVFWPNDVEKAKTYFRALTGPYTDNISDKMIEVWAEEMHANRAWLEGLGMQPMSIGGAEFPEFPGSDCVERRQCRPAPRVRRPGVHPPAGAHTARAGAGR